MKFLFNLQMIAIHGAAAMSLKHLEPEGHEWIPAKHSDSRSPCPGLNLLANHAYLPRSGEGIDLATIRSATVEVFNFAPDVFDGPFKMVQDLNLSTTGNSSTFNLLDLQKHDAIEFDGSLSRDDYYFGDNLHFNHRIWHTVAKDLDLYNVPRSGMGRYVTLEIAAHARAARVKDAKSRNPEFNASASEMMGSPGTTALYMTVLWEDEAVAAPKEWIRPFFEEERLAFKEGFKRQSIQKTGEQLGNRTKQVVAFGDQI